MTIDRRNIPVILVLRVILASFATVIASGCANKPIVSVERNREGIFERGITSPSLALDRALEERILALHPERISESDVRSTLAAGPTPRIILLHGSIYSSHQLMTSFATFLDGMGYPRAKLRDPVDSAYSRAPTEAAIGWPARLRGTTSATACDR